MRQSYGEADLRRRQSDLTANLNAKYSSFDALSRSAKVEAVKNPDLNPYFFKDPYDGLNNNLWRWKTQATRYQTASPEVKNAISSNWYDEQLVPFYRAMGAEPPPKQQWLDNAWTRAMDFDPSVAYRNPFLHGVISAFESTEAQIGRAGQTVMSAVGIPLRAWSEGLSNPSHGVFAGWHNLALNIHNRPAGASAIGEALRFGEGAPGPTGAWARFDKKAADYFSFWHDITPNKTWQEKATSWVAEQAMQLPLYMAGGEAAKLGVGLVKTLGEGLPYIGNLTRTLAATKSGQYASKLLLLGTEGLIYGGATREMDDKSGAWKDALNFMAMGTILGWAGKGVGKVKDFLPTGSAERAAAEEAERAAQLGANGKRAATPEEILTQHRQHIAGIAAAGGMSTVHSVFEEALAHVRASEKHTPEEWDTLKQQMIGADKDRYSTVFPVTEMMRTWLKEQGISMKDMDEAFLKGDTTHYDAFTKYMNEQIDQAMSEIATHVPQMTESEAEAKADAHLKTPEGQAEIKDLIQKGAKPKDAAEQVKAKAKATYGDFIAKAEESRTETGPENQAKKAEGSPLPPGVKPLPPALSKSSPNYSYGVGNNFKVQFEDPRDLAAYVISGKGKSAAHDQFVEYYREHHPGSTGESLKAHGDRIRAALKEQAKNFTGEDKVLKLKSMALQEPVKHEPLLKRVGRYIYDKTGKAVGYSMSVGFDWKLAAKKASESKGWKKASAADNAFWKEFASFHDDPDTDNPQGFVHDLRTYFNPVKHKGLTFEKAGDSDYTNFLGFMYHFRDKLPEPVADKLQEMLLNSKKMSEILNTRQITEDQLEHFAQSVVNHVEMFTRSKWFLQKGEKNIFQSTQPGIGEKTQWQRDLLEDMQKREMGAASSYFPGRSKAASAARDAYKAALALLHADETEAFNAKYPKDKQAATRLAVTMERTKELAKRAASDRLSEGTLQKLMREHHALMEELGGASHDIAQVIHSVSNPEYSKYAPVLQEHEKVKARLDAAMEDANKRKAKAFEQMMAAPWRSPEEAKWKAELDKARDDWQDAWRERFSGIGAATPAIYEAMRKASDPNWGRISKDYAGRTTIWLSRDLMNKYHRGTSPLSFGTLHGQNVGLKDIDRNLNMLKVWLSKPEDAGARAAIEDLLTRAKGMAGPQGVMLATLEGKSAKEWLSQRDTFREEWTHGWQRALLGDYVDDKTFVDNHLDDAVSDKLFQSMPDGIRKHLETNYAGKSSKLHVIEAGAKLLSQHPSKFNMSYDQAADWLLEYTNAITDKYGNDAFKHLTTAIGIGKEIKNIYASIGN